MGGRANPSNFVSEILFAENLVHQHLDIVPDVPVEVDIDARVVRHDGLDGEEVGVHPVEILFLLPDVAVHLFLEGGELVGVEGAFGLGGFGGLGGISAEVDFLGVVGAGGEGRVDVDEVDGAAGVAERGARGEAFAADDEVARGVGEGILTRSFPHALDRLELVKGHAAAHEPFGAVAAGIPQRALEVVQQRLAADRIGEEGDVANGHDWVPWLNVNEDRPVVLPGESN